MIPRTALPAILLGLCGCSTPPPPRPRVTPAASSAPATSALPPPAPLPARPSELTPVTVDAPDTAARQLFLARLAQPALPLAPATSPPRVTGIALDDTRRGEAAGMIGVGPIRSASLAEGQRAAMAVTIGPDDCVTFIAQGGLGVIEVDLFLTTGEGTATKILAQDPSTGPIAVLGGRGRCLGRDDIGASSTLHTEMRRGGGVVLVAEYRR